MPRARSKDRWQLTQEALDCLLRTMHADEKPATERYGRLQRRLIFFFMRHRSNFPEDLADEVLNRLANLLLAGRVIENIEAFSLGIGRLVLLEEHARIRQQEQAYQEVVRNTLPSSHTSNERELELALMEDHLCALPPQVQQLLTEYHSGSGSNRVEGRLRLAKNLGVSMGTLRKRIFDLQVSLRNKLIRTRLPSVPRRK